MSHYLWGLEKRPIKYTCPACMGKKKFKRYINNQTGEYLDESVGRCDRENSCSYHYTPRRYFEDHGQQHTSVSFTKPILCSSLSRSQPSFIDEKHLQSSLRKYDRNNFAMFLKSEVPKLADELLNRYKIGTSYRWPASTVFWQIDRQSNIRAGKIMQYNRYTGKRIKEPGSRVSWMHTHLQLKAFNLEQCLFGEHLLTEDSDRTVGVVESEKTAIIASAYLPMYTWVATGSAGNLNKQMCSALSGRKAVFFPDGDSFIRWEQQAKGLRDLADIEVSNLLDRKLSCEEKRKGLDLADYLLRFECPLG